MIKMMINDYNKDNDEAYTIPCFLQTSVVMNCRPSMRPFRASKMNLLFLFLLAVSFVLSLIVIGYTIMSEDV